MLTQVTLRTLRDTILAEFLVGNAKTPARSGILPCTVVQENWPLPVREAAALHSIFLAGCSVSWLSALTELVLRTLVSTLVADHECGVDFSVITGLVRTRVASISSTRKAQITK
jgi:hypothetical protein